MSALGVPADARPAWDALGYALNKAVDDGVAIPCLDPQYADMWTSDDRDARRWAADRCNQCPVFALCATYARTARESFGIWAGRDRDRSKK